LVKPGFSIIQICKYAGVVIPRFCYHELLSAVGSCRMCLVEVETPLYSKLLIACITKVVDDMYINTNSEQVIKTREDIIEILLLNHPLDCPICDQAGECDLQDQSKHFGNEKSKFFFKRRGVEDKYCGPVIRTIMTRCIHCTRCVRFFSELEGTSYLGTFSRGEKTEIGSYISKNIDSEISGNVIDLCPVGALTANAYTFKARPWELNSYESADLSDSLCSDIYLYCRDSEIFRVLPKHNNEINKSIISDKTRFSFDFNKNNRLNFVFENKNNILVEKKWLSLIKFLDTFITNKSKILFYVDDTTDLLSIKSLSMVSFYNKQNIIIKNISLFKDTNNFYSRALTDKITCLNTEKNVIVFFCINTKVESTILNTLIKIKTNFIFNKIFSLGLFFSNNLGLNFINLKSENLFTLFESKNNIISSSLLKFRNSLFVFGSSFVKLVSNIHFLLGFIKLKLTYINILNITKNSNTNGLQYLNIKNLNTRSIELSKLHIGVNLDDLYKTRKYFNKSKEKSVWYNTHLSIFGINSTFLAPILTAFEQKEIHLNLENKPRKTEYITLSSFDSRSFENLTTSFFKHAFIQKHESSFVQYIIEEAVDTFLFNSNKNNLITNTLFNELENVTFLSKNPIKTNLEDFYCSNKNTKNSTTMLSFSKNKRNNFTNFNKI
jgi:hypothetical protein